MSSAGRLPQSGSDTEGMDVDPSAFFEFLRVLFIMIIHWMDSQG